MKRRFISKELALQAFVLILAYTLFSVFQKVLPRGSAGWESVLFLGFQFLLALSVSTRRFDFGSPFEILIKGLNGIVLFYALTAKIYFPASFPENEILIISSLKIFVGICGLIAFWRPAFILLPTWYIILSKKWLVQVAEMNRLTIVDYLPVIEVALFSAYLFICASLLSIYLKKRENDDFKTTDFGRQAFYICLAIHFANYFHSAIAKFKLGDHIFTWALNNPLYALTIIAKENLFVPVSAVPWIIGPLLLFLSKTYILANSTTLFLQFISIFFTKRIRYTALLTASYDVIHFVIFIVSGIFFWKWVLLNLVVVYACTKVKEPLKTAEQVFLALCILMAPKFFTTAKLAWFDTFFSNDIYLEAVLDDGSSYRVPSNYFLGTSVSMMQLRFGIKDKEKFLPVGTLGATLSTDIMEKSRTCNTEFGGRGYRISLDEESLNRIVKTHHKIILNNVDSNGLMNYDFYPHHGWSNPFEFSDFKKVDKRKIVSYVYNVRARCYKLSGSKVSFEEFETNQVRIDL